MLLPSEQTKEYKNPPHLDPFYREWATHPENMRLHDLKNLWAVERLCDRLNIPLHHWSASDMYEEGKVYDLARDLVHRKNATQCLKHVAHLDDAGRRVLGLQDVEPHRTDMV